MTVLALAIGSSQIAASRIDDEVGEDEIRKAPVPARGVWECCRDLLLDAAGGREVSSVGIGSSGPIDMTAGVVAPSGIAEWRAGFELVDAVKGLFPAAKVPLALDGVCLALAERNFGLTHEVMDTMSVLLSDHVVGSVTVGGLVVVGRTGNAGQLGHVLVPGFDDRCECGGTGCLEAVAGGLSAVRWAQGQGWTGNSLSELVESCVQGNEIAVATVRRAATAVGRAIASVAPLLDFDTVVIGGELANAGPALWKTMNSTVATHARLGSVMGMRLLASELGDLGVLTGAGVLALVSQPEPQPS
ncbi:ROK family protein [Nocardia veterana]|uniref:ROK family protein n=1 Tax=Nocardia veterana TaxID=132249 RepID=A0A7X6RJ20_9NOCA|nr:ROK family protein [Nocardia veterana]NKY87218.1 ROK family protein [Nocardia veterana]